jgi:aminopeptidase YwaD
MVGQGEQKALRRAASAHLRQLCSVVPDRRPGGDGNEDATAYVADVLRHAGWDVAEQRFACLDWSTDGGVVTIDDHDVAVSPAPYGRGVVGTGPVHVLGTSDDLTREDLAGAILVLTGELSAEPLTPKHYPFFTVAAHTRMIERLEQVEPLAIVAVTGRYPPTCGAVEPFPLIEDGDVSIPSANVAPAGAAPLLDADGRPATIELRARRRRSSARNVIGRRGPSDPRVTVIAHVDSKPGTPGAFDNASGVTAALLLSDLLAPARDIDVPVGVELLIVNGEDHYAAPGEIAWLAEHGHALDAIALAVNIDGIGFPRGRASWSTYHVPRPLYEHVAAVLDERSDIVRGQPWYQSDHAIFALHERPALAITAECIDEALSTVVHAPDDTPDRLDVDAVVGVSRALEALIAAWPTTVRADGSVAGTVPPGHGRA